MCEMNNWKKPSTIFCSLILVGAFGAGCNKSAAANSNPDTGGDTDVDSDTDIDSDTDADTDTDTETYTDTDTNTDTNTESTNGGQLAWAKRAGGSSGDEGYGISALPDGSALVTGYIAVTATFGLGETNETALNSDGNEDIFVAKYNSYGMLVWAKRAGGTGGDLGYGISALSDGSALVTGYFGYLGGPATFGPGETGETVLSSDGLLDIFVAKYNADGTLAWVKRAGGTDGDMGYGISALSDGSALVTGWFHGTATFGPGEAGETVLSSDGWGDIFVAKYNPGGTLAWAKRAGGSDVWDHDQSYGIFAFSDGSALVTGSFSGVATFGLGETNETMLGADESYDIFVAKYNADGTLAWAKRAGGTDGDMGRGIFALSDDSALLTGSFQGSATFGPGEINETVVNSDGDWDIFVAKYHQDGTLAWARSAGGTLGDSGLGISALSGGSALATGYFSGTAIFGLGETGETVLNSDGGGDIFMAKYNADGTLAWARHAGGIDNNYGFGISVLSNGSALVAGKFEETATFGLGETNETDLISDGPKDIFVAKFGP